MVNLALLLQDCALQSVPFKPSKLTVQYLPGTARSGNGLLQPRQYTLTHNDLTGQLLLTIGQQYNAAQLSGWYNRLLRDEILAYWQFDNGQPVLHIECHVSGEETWLAPPILRDYIFRREMPLVRMLVVTAQGKHAACKWTTPIIILFCRSSMLSILLKLSCLVTILPWQTLKSWFIYHHMFRLVAALHFWSLVRRSPCSTYLPCSKHLLSAAFCIQHTVWRVPEVLWLAGIPCYSSMGKPFGLQQLAATPPVEQNQKCHHHCCPPHP